LPESGGFLKLLNSTAASRMSEFVAAVSQTVWTIKGLSAILRLQL
jgi:hypothetical protein